MVIDNSESFLILIFHVFDAIGDWVVSILTAMTQLFYVPGTEGHVGDLTFLGCLALVALGISVIFLMIRVIQNFLHFRG